MGRIYKPKGYRKPKSRLKAKRSPVYVPPTTDRKEENAKWLRRK
jgi:hypothetical protein